MKKKGFKRLSRATLTNMKSNQTIKSQRAYQVQQNHKLKQVYNQSQVNEKGVYLNH